MSSPTALCVFIVGTSHNSFISLNLLFLVSFLFLSISLPLSVLLFFSYSLNSSYFQHTHCFDGFLFFLQKKRSYSQPFEGEDSSSSAQSESHEVIGRPAFPLRDPWYTPSMFFPRVSSCGTTPLFMDVCFILSDSSLYDWVLETRLSFSAIVILFGLCCAS